MTRVVRTGAGILSAFALAACLAAPASTPPVPTEPPTSAPTVRVETPSPSPTATPTPTPAATPMPSPVAFTWQPVGQIDPPADRPDLALGFESGYLVAESARSMLWYSPDGQGWSVMHLGDELPYCPGQGLGTVNEVGVSGLVSNDAHAMLRVRVIEDECYSDEATFVDRLWLSEDGRSWHSSDAHDLRAPLAVPGGWEAFGVTPSGLVRWVSADGLSWSDVGPVAVPAHGEPTVRAWSSPTGVRVLALHDRELWEWRLFSSGDGEAWSEFTPGPDAVGDGWLSDIAVVSIDGQETWLIVYPANDGESTRLLSSGDMVHWNVHELPDLEVATIAGTTTGFVVTAVPPCIDDSDFGCDPLQQHQFVSRDGVTWSEITPSIFAVSTFADGPSGVIALGSNDPDWSFDIPVDVWLLAP